jgi:hypothetical protein
MPSASIAAKPPIHPGITRCPNQSSILMFILLPLLFIWSRAPMRYGAMSKSLILGCFSFAALTIWSGGSFIEPVNRVLASDNWDAEEGEIEDPRGDGSLPRVREGTRIGATKGKFSRVGRRWIFEIELESQASDPAMNANAPSSTPDPTSSTSYGNKSANADQTKLRYRVLENLTLQRVVDAIAQDPNDVRWTASGVLTEFEGENWLLLSTVFRAPQSTEAAPYPAASTSQQPPTAK